MTGTQITEFEAALARKIDTKTKPRGALGRVEALAAQVARLQGSLSPRMQSCQLTIFAADHGIARSGVSAYPPEVTRQMVLNFAQGGAAANVFAGANGLALRVVNAGVIGGPFEMRRVLDLPLGEGTQNALEQAAMSANTLARALDHGDALGCDGHWDAVALGEMGIGNTSAATLVAHKLTGLPLEALTGRGTGLDDTGLARKSALLAQAAARIEGALSAREALREYGGFEIAMMTGAMLGAARARRIILVDGFIASVAALVAVRTDPSVRGAMVFAHASAEAGHGVVLDALDAHPLLALDMRLGEGTGAALAWPLLRAAVRMLNDMASFDDAGVSGPA